MKTINYYDFCTTEDKKFICMASNILKLQSCLEEGDYSFAYSVLSGYGFVQYKSCSDFAINKQFENLPDYSDENYELLICIAEKLKDQPIAPILFNDPTMQSMFEDLLNKKWRIQPKERIEIAKQEVARRFDEYDQGK